MPKITRREAISGAIGVMAIPVAAQQTVTLSGQLTTGSTYLVNSESPLSPEERKKQYAICVQRGTPGFPAHQRDPNTLVAVFTPAIWPPPTAANLFDTCRFCETRYRTVTRMEEENKPE